MNSRTKKLKLNLPLNKPTENCPECKELSFVTIESRVTSDSRRRRKACHACGHRSTSYEVSQEFYKKAKNDADIVGRLRAALGGAEVPSVVPEARPEKSCVMCTYMTQGECSFGFPEAGDEFATECLHYLEGA